MTWTLFFILLTALLSCVTLSGAIKETGERIARAIDYQTVTLGIQNTLYHSALPEDIQEAATDRVEREFFNCGDPNCPIHGDEMGAS